MLLCAFVCAYVLLFFGYSVVFFLCVSFEFCVSMFFFFFTFLVVCVLFWLCVCVLSFLKVRPVQRRGRAETAGVAGEAAARRKPEEAAGRSIWTHTDVSYR